MTPTKPLQGSDFLGRGWAFPVNLEPGGRRIAMVEFEQDIRQAIWIILSTAKRERVMRPGFGCGIHDRVFGGMDANTLGAIEATVREALTRFEHRIDLLRVQATPDQAERGRLVVTIDYRVRETNHEFNLVYPFYLNEGPELRRAPRAGDAT